MDLNTESGKLQWIAKQAESLVESLQDYIRKNGIDMPGATPIRDNEIQSLIANISGRLQKIKIDGNEELLEDVIAIYDRAIESIDEELERDAQVADGDLDKFTPNELDAFNRVKEALKDSKNTTAGPLKTILDELTEEIDRGEIDEQYRQARVSELDGEKREAERQIGYNVRGLENFSARTKEVREAYDKAEEIADRFYKIATEIAEIETKLADPDLSDEERSQLEEEKADKEELMLDCVIEMQGFSKNPTYERMDGETDEQYRNRLKANSNDVIASGCTKFLIELSNKLEELKDYRIRIWDEETKEFTEMTVEDYMRDVKYKDLSNKILTDIVLNNEGVKEDRKKVEELSELQSNYKDSTRYYGSELPAEEPKALGFVDRFNYYRKEKGTISSFFRAIFTRKDDEKILAKRNKDARKNNRYAKDLRSGLRVAENELRNGKRVQDARRAAQGKLFEGAKRDDPNIEHDDDEPSL